MGINDVISSGSGDCFRPFDKAVQRDLIRLVFEQRGSRARLIRASEDAMDLLDHGDLLAASATLRSAMEHEKQNALVSMSASQVIMNRLRPAEAILDRFLR